MDATQAARFRGLLTARLEEIVSEGDASLASTAKDGGEGKVDDDAAPLSEMNQVIASNRNRERAQRKARIEAAIERLDEDPEMFGVCEVCDEDVPRRRLELMPWATMCIRCQEKVEAELPKGRRHLTDYK